MTFDENHDKKGKKVGSTQMSLKMQNMSKDSMTGDLIKAKFQNPTMVSTLTKSMSPNREKQLMRQLELNGEQLMS